VVLFLRWAGIKLGGSKRSTVSLFSTPVSVGAPCVDGDCSDPGRVVGPTAGPLLATPVVVGPSPDTATPTVVPVMPTPKAEPARDAAGVARRVPLLPGGSRCVVYCRHPELCQELAARNDDCQVVVPSVEGGSE
jgi:hypothetical protein